MIAMLQRIGFKKTTLLAFGTLLGTLGAILTEKIVWTEGLPYILSALGILFLRDAVAKGR